VDAWLGRDSKMSINFEVLNEFSVLAVDQSYPYVVTGVFKE